MSHALVKARRFVGAVNSGVVQPKPTPLSVLVELRGYPWQLRRETTTCSASMSALGPERARRSWMLLLCRQGKALASTPPTCSRLEAFQSTPMLRQARVGVARARFMATQQLAAARTVRGLAWAAPPLVQQEEGEGGCRHPEPLASPGRATALHPQQTLTQVRACGCQPRGTAASDP
jgi:hypothetical protein